MLHADLDLETLHAKRLTLFGVSNKLRSKQQKSAAVPRFVTDVLPHFANGRIVPRILELAERLPLPQAIVVAHTCAAWSEWSRGALAAACAHGEWAIAANLTEPMTFPSAFDLVGYAFGTTAFATMARGDLAAARALSAQGRAWSDHTGRPVDHATSLALAALLHAFMNEPAAAGAYAAQSVAVAEEHGFRQWRATGRIIAAWATAVERRSTESLATVVARIDEYARMGLRTQLSAFLCLAAGAQIVAGKKEAPLELLTQAEAHARTSGEQCYLAEVHRLHGEIALPREPRKAEARFQSAIEVARAAGAKLWELRATVSLATLRRREKKPVVARQLLDAALASFPPELDAPDVRAARTLRARVA